MGQKHSRLAPADDVSQLTPRPLGDLERRVQLVEGGLAVSFVGGLDEALVRTPSVRRDLDSGLTPAEAGKASRLRSQLRELDAEIAQLKSELVRGALLRGPSGRRRICDENVTLGGCGEEFAEEDGIYCGDCSLFLCFRCFGGLVVSNECQVGGRFDRHVSNDGDETGMADASAPGSLPCPLYPQACSCSHIALYDIQRALMHPDNRGVDGIDEDLDSDGLSPHKIFLIARRRQAEAQLAAAAKESGGETFDSEASFMPRESMLVRTMTEARHVTEVVREATLARTQSSTRGVLAEKLDQVQQLRDELRQRPVANCIPTASRRSCAQCLDEFAVFEGGQCLSTRPEHFLCNVCFGGYLLRACAPGGAYEQQLTNKDGMTVSPPGKLPCPFFVDNPTAAAATVATMEAEGGGGSTLERQNSLGLTVSPIVGECECGALDFSVVEHVLLDPRNASVAFWREKRGAQILAAQRGSREVSESAGSGLDWTWGEELLSRGFTPSNVHETARLRVGAMLEHAERERRELEITANPLSGAAAGTDTEATRLAELYHKVIVALDRGGCIQCPKCGVHAVKDDACVHMDSCPCGSHWCFLCGKFSGAVSDGHCPRGEGGCDAASCYLERHEGWGDFALDGESAARGAQKEFLRQRQAYLVRKVKEACFATTVDGEALWARLRAESPGLLQDVPTDGRSIDWEALDTAEFPLFGANKGNTELRGEDLLVDVEVDADAQQRLEAHFEEEMRRAARAERAERYKRVITAAKCLVIALIPVVWTVMQFVPQPNPAHYLDPHAALHKDVVWPQVAPPSPPSVQPDVVSNATNQTANGTAVAPPPPPTGEGEDEPLEWDLMRGGCAETWCRVVFWMPFVETVGGFVLLMICACFDIDDAREEVGAMVTVSIVAFTMVCWPMLVGPFGPWAITYLLEALIGWVGGAMWFIFCIVCTFFPDDSTFANYKAKAAACLVLLTIVFNTFANYKARALQPESFWEDAPSDEEADAAAKEAEAAKPDDLYMELAEYSCIPSCVAYRVMLGIMAAPTVSALYFEVKDNWANDWARHWYLKIPITLLGLIAGVGWPQLLHSGFYATGTPFMYWWTIPYMGMVWGVGLAGGIGERGRNILDDYDLIDVALIAPPWILSACLYTFRISVPTVPPPLWFTIFFYQSVIFGVLAIAGITLIDGDIEDALFSWLATLIFFQTLNASIPPSLVLMILLLIFVWAGPAFMAALMAITRGQDRCIRIMGAVSLPLIALYVVVIGLVYTYGEEPPPYPPALGGYMVSGAGEPLLNGLYVVRSGLLDDDHGPRGKDGSCLQTTPVTFWQRDLALSLDTPLDPFQSDTGSDPRPNTAASYILHQPVLQTLWVVTDAATALTTCGASPTSYLHSPQLDCHETPNGAGCAGKWREVSYTTSTVTNASDNTTTTVTAEAGQWVDAPQLQVHPWDCSALVESGNATVPHAVEDLRTQSGPCGSCGFANQSQLISDRAGLQPYCVLVSAHACRFCCPTPLHATAEGRECRPGGGKSGGTSAAFANARVGLLGLGSVLAPVLLL